MQTKSVMAAFLTIIVLCVFRFQDSIDMTDSASHSPPEAHSGETLDDAVSRLSNIMQEENDFSTNRASAVCQLSTVRENEAPKASPAVLMEPSF